MGRDVTGLRIDKKPGAVNAKSNGTFHGVVHIAPEVVPETDETKGYEAVDHTAKGTPADECNVKQDVQGMKSIDHELGEKILKAEAQNSIDKNLSSPVKPASGSSVNDETVNMNSLEPLTPGLESGKRTSFPNHANGVETADSGLHYLSKTSDLHSPTTAKKSLPYSPTASSKTPQTDDKKYDDEDDNWSLASSAATSVRSKYRVTVPVAPTFRCMERLERRKQFYTKLEEKHKALEQEKLDYEARTKEEEAAAIKQLRKTMAYKANPVPNFYREGPPPKVELKKLPVTRAKSPNLSRRKSCSDAMKSSPVEKGTCARTTRQSIGVFKESKPSPTSITPKSKSRAGVRNVNATDKTKGLLQQMKETTENSHATGQGNLDTGVEP